MQNELAVFGGVALAHLLGVASPGPDFAIVVRQALAHGRGAGVWTAAGVGAGITFHVAYGLFGLSWLTQRFPAALTVIGAAGGLFLLWMGAQALRAQPLPAESDAAVPASAAGSRHFSIGLLTNVLNPKATLFFVALFTVVVTGPVSTPLMLALGLWLPFATFAWFALVAFLFSNALLRAKLRRVAHWIDRAMGLVLIGLGVAVLASLLR